MKNGKPKYGVKQILITTTPGPHRIVQVAEIRTVFPSMEHTYRNFGTDDWWKEDSLRPQRRAERGPRLRGGRKGTT